MNHIGPAHSRLTIADILVLIALIATALIPAGWIAWILVTYIMFPFFWLLTHVDPPTNEPRSRFTETLGHATAIAVLFNWAILPLLLTPGATLIIDTPVASFVLISVIAYPCVLFALWASLSRILHRHKPPLLGANGASSSSLKDHK